MVVSSGKNVLDWLFLILVCVCVCFRVVTFVRAAVTKQSSVKDQ